MHITAERLFDALKQVANVDGRTSPGAVAAFLKETPAVITNWKSRGVSKAGQLKVHAMTGISPHWLATGEGEMLPMKGPGASNVVPVTTGAAKTEALLTELQAIVDGLAPILQEPGRDALVKWAQGQTTMQATAATLQAYEQASKALPQAPAAVSETPIKKPSTHD